VTVVAPIVALRVPPLLPGDPFTPVSVTHERDDLGTSSRHSLDMEADDYDSPWKDAIQSGFPDFMAFYFPDAAGHIDWGAGYTFLGTELRQVVQDAELGRRFADVLARVTTRSGRAEHVYVHVEVQGGRDHDFAQRMFVYLEFGVAKLLDFEPDLATLPHEPNPFALVTAAHLLTRRTRGDDPQRYEAKRKLIWLLYRQGRERQQILDLLAVLDWMMRLPMGLEHRLWQDIDDFDEGKPMRYVTSIERIGIEKGVAQGLVQGMTQGEAAMLERLLDRRFGPLSDTVRQRVSAASSEELIAWGDRMFDAKTLGDVFGDI
jgi:Domain of unknown function (DUF4351)